MFIIALRKIKTALQICLDQISSIPLENREKFLLNKDHFFKTYVNMLLYKGPFRCVIFMLFDLTFTGYN